VAHLSRLDPTSSTIYISSQIEALTGYSAQDWIDDAYLWVRIVHSDDRPRMLVANERHILDGDPISEDYRVIARDGQIVWVREESRVLRDDHGAAVCSQGILLNVTERKRVEQELQQNVEFRHQLTMKLVQAEEDERARVAGGIHDDSIQVMSGLNARIDALLRRVSDPEVVRELGGIKETLGIAIQRLRSLAFDLLPPSLDRDGLAVAIQGLLVDFSQQSGVEANLDDHLQQEPSVGLRTVAYRIVKEALLNIRKHAHALHVVMAIEPRADGVLVSIKDDGVGFDVSSVEQSGTAHVGLRVMSERAKLAGGWCRVAAGVGIGTTVEFWLPSDEGYVSLGDRRLTL
jgi:PAS domain S-box-containing protein